jgi:hypothetical protein
MKHKLHGIRYAIASTDFIFSASVLGFSRTELIMIVLFAGPVSQLVQHLVNDS